MLNVRNAIAVALLISVAGCAGSSNSTPAPPAPLPSPSNTGTVPAGVTAISGYNVSVFVTPSGSTKPDSVVQIGSNIFVGTGDTVNPDGTPGSAGTAQTEVLQYDQTGKLLKTYEVPGHNDGLMAFDRGTLWAMSNEDANAKLVVINIASGTQQTYVPQASLLSGGGALPHGGGLDDMQLINGKVYVSGSNPNVSTTAACPPNSSTPGCPNGVSTGAFVYVLSLNGDGATFNLTPVATSGANATNIATGAAGTVNVTDPDSEVVAPDGQTLIVDGQGDSELAFITNPGGTPSISYLPLTLGGAPQQVDDTRFVTSSQTFLLLADTPTNTVYRIDGPFNPGDAYSAGQTMLLKTNTSTGVTTPIVSGFQAPHGLLFVTSQ